MRAAAALTRSAGLSEFVHAGRERIVAFQTLCKQRYLAEGESVPFLIDGEEVLVLWPDGGQPRAFVGRCPHEGQSLVNNSDFNGRILVCTVHALGVPRPQRRGRADWLPAARISAAPDRGWLS